MSDTTRRAIRYSHGTATRSRVPFGDARTPSAYAPHRFESSGVYGTYTTDRGRARVVGSLARDLVADGARVAHVDHGDRSLTVYWYGRTQVGPHAAPWFTRLTW